ncbi:MAG: RNA methyltransferase [Rubritalea sp.]|jgi:tRNA/rRNA methyltransferase|tara:strand:- start:5555 stop:6298 length:744 start_codon:yes stop_codon:yes gene_type:complete
MPDLSPTKPVIVLVQTQMAVNIGMCARAMLNCGLDELRLVAPRDGWPNTDAIAPSTDAKRVLESAKVYSTVADAVADCHQVYAATARIRHLNTPAVTAAEAAAEMHSATAASEGENRPAILFGPEASGLDNDAMSYADRLLHYPMNPEFTSLNLAQAVLLFSWEWWSTRAGATTSYEQGWEAAPKAELDHYLQRLEDELEKAGFFTNPAKRPNTIRKIRALFSRSNPSSQEVKSLQGIITALNSPRR